MKIAIFGATGQTGGHVVDQALARGWQVSVMVRDAAKLTSNRERLSVVQGGHDQPVAILTTLQGVDAVLSTMGYGADTLTIFGAHLVSSMGQAGVRRVVSLIGASVWRPGDRASVNLAMLRAVTGLMAADAKTDGKAHAERLAASGLDFTLVRPPRLTHAAATGQIRHGSSLPLGPQHSIPRGDLAKFMLDCVAEARYIRAAPMVASA